MHIDAYQFGEIVIDGKTYDKDCKIIAGSVMANWWRATGHSLATEDISDILQAKPAILVVGCGAHGMMKIPAPTRHVVRENGIELIDLPTKEAALKFNELAETGQAIAGAFHLTC